jgi:hypothetical protein
MLTSTNPPIEAAMDTRALARTTTLSRPWPARAWDGICAAWRHWREAARARRQLDRDLRELAVVAELDARVLRDIGAPDWAQAEADERHQSRRVTRDSMAFGGRY